VKWVSGSDMIAELNKWSTSESNYKNKLLLIGMNLKSVKISDGEVAFGVDMSSENRGKRDTVPDPSYLYCLYKDSEKSKLAGLESLRGVYLVGRLKEVRFKSPVIEDCEIVLDKNEITEEEKR
jgi:hypothetical protein